MLQKKKKKIQAFTQCRLILERPLKDRRAVARRESLSLGVTSLCACAFVAHSRVIHLPEVPAGSTYRSHKEKKGGKKLKTA